MKRQALERFRREFHRWIRAYTVAHGRTADAERLWAALKSRVGDGLAHIGAAYLSGWLITESEPGRGYFVREADRPGPGGGQFTLIHRGRGQVDPCWELFVQLADYARLRPLAERYGQVVRLEDHRMDLTVRSGPVLVLYVEHKEAKATAMRLVREMREYGATGFGFHDPDVGNDPLRKAKYLARARPVFFGVSAVGYRQLFRVDYGRDNRFRLIDDPRPLSAPLAEHPAPPGVPPPEPRSAADALAIEVERVCRNIWVSLGTGRTAFNFYLAEGEHGDAIVAGVSKDGRVWTDVKGLGPDRAARLAGALQERGVSLDTSRVWASWRLARNRSRPFTLGEGDPAEIAAAIREAVGS